MTARAHPDVRAAASAWGGREIVTGVLGIVGFGGAGVVSTLVPGENSWIFLAIGGLALYGIALVASYRSGRRLRAVPERAGKNSLVPGSAEMRP